MVGDRKSGRDIGLTLGARDWNLSPPRNWPLKCWALQVNHRSGLSDFFNTGNHQPATLTPVEFQEANRQEASYPSPSPLLTSIPPTVKCNGGSNTDARPTSSPLLFLLFFVEAVGERVCPANIDPGPACPSVCPSVPSRSSFSKKPPLDLLIPIESCVFLFQFFNFCLHLL